MSLKPDYLSIIHSMHLMFRFYVNLNSCKYHLRLSTVSEFNVFTLKTNAAHHLTVNSSVHTTAFRPGAVLKKKIFMSITQHRIPISLTFNLKKMDVGIPFIITTVDCPF